MKTFLRIKRIHVYDHEEQQIVIFNLRCGYDVIKDRGNYVNQQTGEVYEPLYDEFNDELVGFIG